MSVNWKGRFKIGLVESPMTKFGNHEPSVAVPDPEPYVASGIMGDAFVVVVVVPEVIGVKESLDDF